VVESCVFIRESDMAAKLTDEETHLIEFWGVVLYMVVETPD
jgi:hypothetical protein